MTTHRRNRRRVGAPRHVSATTRSRDRLPARHVNRPTRRWSPVAVAGTTLTLAGLLAGSALALSGPLPDTHPLAKGPDTSTRLRPEIASTLTTSAPLTSPATDSITTRRTTRPSRSTARRTPATTSPAQRRSSTTTSDEAASASSDEQASALSTRERSVFTLTNKRRTEKGCDPLRVDSRLVKAARGHAKNMVEKNFFDHTAPDGSTPSDRAQDAGFPSGVGENIAVGYSSASAVMTGWMNSSGHRANILNCDYTVIGVGYSSGTVLNQYGSGAWVQVFGRT